MCGRYYVDDETAREIERIIRIADEKIRKVEPAKIQAKDIHPTDIAPILTASEHGGISCSLQKWGLLVLMENKLSLTPGVNRPWKKTILTKCLNCSKRLKIAYLLKIEQMFAVL